MHSIRMVARSYPFLGLVGAVVGLALFYVVLGRPAVGVIVIPYTILDSGSVAEIERKLDYARERRAIRAVVIKMDSPGGAIAPSEELFLRLLDLKRTKPVVVAVDDMAASGAYLAAVTANEIYAKPSSLVGNVGAILFLPGVPSRPDETLVPTGPYKAEGASERMYINMLELAKETLVTMVISQRGERLRLAKEELAQGRVYIGLEAVRNGLVDAIGTDLDAIRGAAAHARLRSYRVVDVNEAVNKAQRGSRFSYGSQSTQGSGQTGRLPRDIARDSHFPHIFYLHVEPR